MNELFDINSLTVVKHNRVIDASYSMSIYEQRILLTCIAKIDSTKELPLNHIFTVSVDDVIDLVDVGRDSAYSNLRSACETLFTNIISIQTPDDPEIKILRT